ncbi:Hxxxd-type acyl-transferase family protein [Thalictrum thalictroides]|uniref:Hxxxd-type acyl-transferase family protein n=1 Tax=Thalictrum thalictroides TaxID=46969 RepID=A0A7J6W3A3_THATH|nr:Hxxxd-type acyl-transferase family protein [Thalictrum thalictroides]
MAILSQGIMFPSVHHSNIVSFDHVSHPTMHLHTHLKKYSKTQFSHHQLEFFKSISRSRSPCQSKKHCFRPSAVLETLEHTVTIQRTSLISPLEETEKKSMFLSNIDRRLNFKATTILFFSRNPKFSFEQIVTKLEVALRKILVQYDFLSGRLRWNTEKGQQEIDCNGAGAGFVVASCNSTFEELGGIGSPNVANQQFALRKWNASADDQPLLVMQVSS